MNIRTDIESMKTESVYKPIHFFAITFLLTWIFGFIAAYFSYQKGMEALQGLSMIPGLFAPFIAAMIMVSGAKNQGLRKNLWAKLSLRKINPRYLPAILLIMPFALFLATAISWHPLGAVARAAVFCEWLLPARAVEYQHCVCHQFLRPDFRCGHIDHWIYYKSNRSIAAAILFHFMFNLFSVLFQAEQFTKCIITIIPLIISVVIVLRNKKFFFEQASVRSRLAAEAAYA